MESFFDAVVTVDKAVCREFGGIARKKNKALFVLYIIGWVALVIGCPLVIFFGIDELLYSVSFIGLFYVVWYMFIDITLGNNSYKGIDKRFHGGSVSYYFNDNDIHICSQFENSSLSYAAVVDVCESDNLFALYTGANAALLIPKGSFVKGSVDDFRNFISMKTGKPVTTIKYKKNTGKKVLGIAGAIAVYAVAVIGGIAARQAVLEKEKTFTSGDYSITLTAEFEQTEYDEFDFSAETNGACVYSFKVARDELVQYGYDGEITMEEYIESVLSSFDDINEVTEIKSLDNGMLYVTYASEADGELYFYTDIFTQSEDAFWGTEFYCFYEDKADYEQKFIDWGKTVTIGQSE
ncbi:MAG: YcxB family protein [Acutalibacteraceae bacterium]